MKNFDKLKERLIEFANYKEMPISRFESTAELCVGAISQMKKGIHSANVEKILATFPELNANWIFTGRGTMLMNEEEKQVCFTQAEPQNNTLRTEPTEKEYEMLLDQIKSLKGQILDIKTLVDQQNNVIKQQNSLIEILISREFSSKQ